MSIAMTRTMNQPRNMGRPVLGFTLIELLVTVAIIAILSTIAYSSYREQVIKSRRAAAAVCLQEAAQIAERFYSVGLTYVGVPAASCDSNVSQYYAVGFVGAPAARTYTLRAVPLGTQSSGDTMCATLTLSQLGVRAISGTGAVASCW